jgi:hypothetical protein
MFETLNTPRQFPWRYFVQLLLLYPASWTAGALVSPLLSSIGNHGRVHFAGYDCVLLLCIGTAAGWAMARTVPSFRASGEWIWVVPLLLLIWDLVRSLRSPYAWPAESLFATPGEGAIGPYVGGIPAFSAIGYSTGLLAFGRGHGPTSRAVIGFGIALAILIAGLREFETARMEKWSMVRSLAGKPARLSRDPAALCADLESADISLRWFEYVELLGEQRACPGGEALRAGDAAPQHSTIIYQV